MPNKLKELVSKNKKRYQDDGFDLDLAYITKNIIAMGFPAENLEGVYRNHFDDVNRFLEQKHENHYKIYNLCQEKVYNKSKFKGCVVWFPFDDHNPPMLHMMKSLCEDVKQWHDENPDNVAVIHCKAGKGRTGVMISAYLVYINLFDAEDALKFYAAQRTKDQKGVTIPSQIRYVHYFAKGLKEHLTLKDRRLSLVAIKFSSIPHVYGGSSSCNLYFTVTIRQAPEGVIAAKFRSPYYEGLKKGDCNVLLDNNNNNNFIGDLMHDVRIDFYSKNVLAKGSIFHFWFNTNFVKDYSHLNYSQCTIVQPSSNCYNSYISNINNNNDPVSDDNNNCDRENSRENSLKNRSIVNEYTNNKRLLMKELLQKVQKTNHPQIEGISYQCLNQQVTQQKQQQQQQQQQLQQQQQQLQQQQQKQPQPQQQQQPKQQQQQHSSSSKGSTPDIIKSTFTSTGGSGNSNFLAPPSTNQTKANTSPKLPTKGLRPNNENLIATRLSSSSSSPTSPHNYLSLTLTKSELDKAIKDKQNKLFPSDFFIQLYFTKVDDSAVSPPPPTASTSLLPGMVASVGDDDDDEDDNTDTDDEDFTL